jgi:RHS repeat-associated protein
VVNGLDTFPAQSKTVTIDVPQTVADYEGIDSLDEIKNFMVALQIDDAPIYSGVYRWEMELQLLAEGENPNDENAGILFREKGESVVVVQSDVTPTDFSPGTSPSAWTYQSPFGNGWFLNGVPQLIVDDYNDWFESAFDDRLVVAFPGQNPSVFRPSFENAGGFGRLDYYSGQFEAVDVDSTIKSLNEWGTLRTDDNGLHIIYKSVDDIEYVFKRFEPGNNDDPESVAKWQITEIRASSALPPGTNSGLPRVVFQYDEVTTNATYKQLQTITATDGGVTAFNYDENGHVDSLTLPGNRQVDFTIAADGTLQGIHHLNPAVVVTGAAMIQGNDPAERVRRFDYDANGRLELDRWYSNPDAATVTDPSALTPSRVTSFDYDILGNLSKISLGGDDTGAIVYEIRSADSATLETDDMQVTTNELQHNAKTVAIVRQRTGYNKLDNSQAVQSADGYGIVEFEYDASGNLVRREELYENISGGDPTSLNVERWTYDSLNSVKSHTDPVGRNTYFHYDYEIAPYYAAGENDPDDPENPDDPADNNGVPLYDHDDYHGNVTKIVTVSGNSRFDYETDDETGKALGRLVSSIDTRGVETIYVRDDEGRIRSARTVRGSNDGATNRVDDHFEEWTYDALGRLQMFVSALGLQTTYRYGKDSTGRKLQSTLTKDLGVDGAAGGGDDEVTITWFTYDAYGQLDKVIVNDAEHMTSDDITDQKIPASDLVISITDYDYDATGLLRRVRSLAPDLNNALANLGNNPILSSQEYGYDADGMQSLAIDGNGNRTKFNYDERGLLTSTVAAEGGTHVTTYDGRDLSVAQTTTYEYYADGSLRSSTLSDHNGTAADDIRTEYFIDPVGRINWSRSNGIATHSNLNTGTGLVNSTLVDEVFRTDFDLLGRVLRTENLLTGAKASYEYGDIRHDAPTKVSVKSNRGVLDDGSMYVDEDVATLLAYDQIGNVVYEKANIQPALARVFDELGYLKSMRILETEGAFYEYETDADGNIVNSLEHRSQPNGNVTDIRTVGQYDQQGRLRKTYHDYVDADMDGEVEAGEFLEVESMDYGFIPIDFEGDGDDDSKAREIVSRSIDGTTSKLQMDAAGRVAVETNALGGVTKNTYDAAGNMVEVRFEPPDGDPLPDRRTTYEYDDLNRLRKTMYHGSTSYATAVDYFQPGDLPGDWDMATIDAYNVNAAGYPATTVGPATLTKYDSMGHTIAVKAPDPQGDNAGGDAPYTIVSYDYNAPKLVTSITTRLTTVRGEQDLVDNVADPSQRQFHETRVNRQLVNERGAVIASADRIALSGATVYNDAVGVANPTLATAYYANGFQERVRNEYDEDGQLSRSTDGEGHSTGYSYTEPRSGTRLLSEVTKPNGEKTKFTYDSAGNRRSLTQVHDNQADNITTWTYDALGRTKTETTSIDIFTAPGMTSGTDNAQRSWQYNGLITTYTDRDGRVTTSTLNPAARTRVETATFGGQTYTATFTLHSDGTTFMASDVWSGGIRNGDTSSIVFTYDEYGRLRGTMADSYFDGVNSPTSQLTTGYYASGVRESDTWWLDVDNVLNQATQTSYRVDKLNRIDGVSRVVSTEQGLWQGASSPGDQSVEITYNADGTRKLLTRYDWSNYDAADKVGQLNELQHNRLHPTEILISRYELVRDPNGRVVTALESFGSAHSPTPLLVPDLNNSDLEYDDAGQLVYDPKERVTREHDQAGNRIDNGSQVGLANRVKEDAKFKYQYDREGNIVQILEKSSNVVRTFTWDHQGRLQSVTFTVPGQGAGDSSIVEIGYDVLGRKIAEKQLQTDDGSVVVDNLTGFVYDGSSVIFELNLKNGGVVDRTYFRGPGVNEVFGVSEASIDLWAFADMLGTVRTWGSVNNPHEWQLLHRNFNADGNPFSPFGAVTNGPFLLGDVSDLTLQQAPIIYAGHTFDRNLNLYDMKARWYDPFSGRFLAEDPLGFAAGDANLYRYGAGDPANNIDPDGRVLPVIALGIAALGTWYAHGQFSAAADNLNAESAIFYSKPVYQTTQADVDQYNAALDQFGSRVTRGSIGASFITLPLGGPVLSGALGGAVFGGTRSYATGASGSTIAVNAANNAALGAILGRAFSQAGRVAAPYASRAAAFAGRNIGNAGLALTSRLPAALRGPLYEGVLATHLYGASIVVGAQGAQAAREAAFVAFFRMPQAALHTARAGSLSAAIQLQARAAELNLARGPIVNERFGTTAVVRAWNTRTHEFRIFVATEAVTRPRAVVLQPGEEYVRGIGHAEETIFGNLGEEWIILEGGVSRNVCKTRCTPIIESNGLTLGGPIYGIPAHARGFRSFY